MPTLPYVFSYKMKQILAATKMSPKRRAGSTAYCFSWTWDHITISGTTGKFVHLIAVVQTFLFLGYAEASLGSL